MPIKSRKVGSGISTETRKTATVDSFSEEDLETEVLRLQRMPESLNQKWGTKSRLIAELRKRLEGIRADAPEPDNYGDVKAYYAERETEPWYILNAVRHVNLIERCIKQDRIWEAVSLAYDLGELMTELTFKMDWEGAALEGQKMREGRIQASRGNRRHLAIDRYRLVKRYIEGGMTVREACVRAARELGDKGPGSARNDYYKVKNSRSNADGLER